MTDRERAHYWEDTATKYRRESEYYRAELAKAHALLGRVLHQASERWDSVNITEYFPTNNLRGEMYSHNQNKDTGGRDD